MATLTSNSSRVFDPQGIVVTVGGTRRQDFIPLQVVKRSGFTPDTALFLLPWARAVDDLSGFDYALVMIFVQGSSQPVFRGYLSARTAEEAPGVDRVVMQAVSITGYIDRLPVGWGTQRGEALFTKQDRVTGEDSGYTLADIMAGLEAITLDANWSDAIRLGDVNVLNLTGADLRPTSLRYTGTDYRTGLQRVLTYAPDIGVVERHTTSKTFLDFYKWGDFSSGIHPFRACDESHEGPEDGAVVTRLKWVSDDGGIYNRARGWGAPVQFMMTFTTNHLTAPIVPAWSNPSVWFSPELTTPLLDWALTTAESSVLANPRRGDPSNSFYVTGYDQIFRRYQLPPNIWRIYQKDRQNALIVGNNDTDKKSLNIQVFRRRWPLVENEEETALVWDEENPTYELIEGASITEDGFIEFREPVIQDYIIQHDGGKTIKTRRPVDIFVTVTISRSDGIRTVYDTGVRNSVPLESVGDSGLVYTFVNNDVKFALVAAPTGGITDWRGLPHTFDCTYYNEFDLQWQSVLAADAVVIRDDSVWLGNVTERSLAERSKRRMSADVMVPYLATAVDVGEGVQVLGRNIGNKVMTAVSVQFDMVNQRTTIKATDQVPRVVSGRESVGEGFGLARDLLSRGLPAANYSDGTLAPGETGPPLPAGYELSTGFDQGVPPMLRRPEGSELVGPPSPREAMN